MRIARLPETQIDATIVSRHFDSAISAKYSVVEITDMPSDIPEIILPIKICS